LFPSQNHELANASSPKDTRANTGKLRKKLMTGSSHANVQYIKDTMALEEDENDHRHPDLIVVNYLQDKVLTQQ